MSRTDIYGDSGREDRWTEVKRRPCGIEHAKPCGLDTDCSVPIRYFVQYDGNEARWEAYKNDD